MNNVIKASTLAMFWLVISSSAHGLSSTCDFNSNIRSAWHLVNMNWYESAISNVLEMQTNLAEPQINRFLTLFGMWDLWRYKCGIRHYLTGNMPWVVLQDYMFMN